MCQSLGNARSEQASIKHLVNGPTDERRNPHLTALISIKLEYLNTRVDPDIALECDGWNERKLIDRLQLSGRNVFSQVLHFSSFAVMIIKLLLTSCWNSRWTLGDVDGDSNWFLPSSKAVRPPWSKKIRLSGSLSIGLTRKRQVRRHVY